MSADRNELMKYLSVLKGLQHEGFKVNSEMKDVVKALHKDFGFEQKGKVGSISNNSLSWDRLSTDKTTLMLKVGSSAHVSIIGGLFRALINDYEEKSYSKQTYSIFNNSVEIYVTSEGEQSLRGKRADYIFNLSNEDKR